MSLLALMGCEPEVQCDENTACPFGEVCFEGECKEIPCATSDQCGMEEYCLDRSCVDGCAEDSDCYPGMECNVEAAQCVASGCRDTQLDCDFREYCNTANGQCYDAGGYYCRSCNDESDCGGGGNLCLNFGGGYEYCGVECSTDTDCPAGFGCLPIGDFNGNIISYQCATYCWLYEDGDFPEGPPPRPTVQELTAYPVCLQEDA